MYGLKAWREGWREDSDGLYLLWRNGVAIDWHYCVGYSSGLWSMPHEERKWPRFQTFVVRHVDMNVRYRSIMVETAVYIKHHTAYHEG